MAPTLRRIAFAALALALAARAEADTVSVLEAVRRSQEMAFADTAGAWRKPSVPRDRVEFEYGGWAGTSLVGFTNDDNDRRTDDPVTSLVMSDLRLWGKVWFRGGSTGYIRLRHIGYDFGTSPGVADPRLPNAGADLDLAYLDVPHDSGDWRLGRQYVRYGDGIALSAPIDGVRFSSHRGNFDYRLLAGRNKPNDFDLDPTIPSPRRFFGGVDVSYRRHDNDRFFGYVLAERDDSSNPPTISPAAQSFRYDAEYLGLGMEGRMAREWGYHLEGIYQGGESFSIGSAAVANPIAGLAAIGRVTHTPDVRMQPIYSAEYAFGSGDGGRLPGLSTLSASAAGTTDGAFRGFGRYEGGIALNPRLSNLHVVRVGAAMRPWEDAPGFEDLLLGGKLSVYRKDEAIGGISDPQATLPSADVGTGLDLYMGWRIYSDLSWLLQYGRFGPGEAYPATQRDTTNTVFGNLTYSF